MRKILSVAFMLNLLTSCAQTYQFINQTFEKEGVDNVVYLFDNFIDLETYIKFDSINEETLQLWWSLKQNNPPIELFLNNFNIDEIKSELYKSKEDSIINFNKLKTFFKRSSADFIKSNPENEYTSISKPIFNKEKNWAIIVKSSFIPYTQTGGSGMMIIYVKINNNWIKYYEFNIWLS